MKILIDTSLESLFINLVDNDYNTIDTTLFVEKRKADNLPIETEKILNKNNKTIKDIDSIYITMGPGSFMGARTAFVYARTIAQMSDIKLFVSSTFALFDGEAFIDARGGKAYASDLTIVDAPENFTVADYDSIISNPKKYMDRFELQTDLLSLRPMYLKEPQIGGK